MPVRAKFRVLNITRQLGSVYDRDQQKTVTMETHNVKMYAVTGGSQENDRFFASTPSGNIEVSTIHPDQFELGKEYYVDFTPAE